MIMDRQTIIAISMAIGVMLFFAGLLFGPRGSVSADTPRPTYSPGDIRYNYQQADAKDKAKRKRDKKPAKEQFVTDGSTTSGGGDDNVSEESAEEPSAEEPDAEEPAIE